MADKKDSEKMYYGIRINRKIKECFTKTCKEKGFQVGFTIEKLFSDFVEKTLK